MQALTSIAQSDGELLLKGWTDGGASAHAITAPSTSSQPHRWLAEFYRAFPVTGTASPQEGGTVTLLPPSNTGYYAEGSRVTVQATPAAGFTFTGFSGTFTGTAATQTIAINGPVAVKAYFQRTGGASH